MNNSSIAEEFREKLNENDASIPFLDHEKSLKQMNREESGKSSGWVSTISPKNSSLTNNKLSEATIRTNLGSNLNSSGSFELEFEKRQMSRIILGRSVPDIVFKGSYYSVISCPTLTTLLLNNQNLGGNNNSISKYSFLTKPINNSKNFFLRKNSEAEREDLINDLTTFQNLDKNFKFDLKESKWDISKTNYKLSEDIITNFLFALNYELEPVNKKISSIKKDLSNRKNVFARIALFSLITFIISLYAIYVNLFVDTVFSSLFLLIFIIIGVTSGASLFYGLLYGVCIERDEYVEYQILQTIINKYKSVEELLCKWNQQIFMPMGIIVNIPYTLNYIHFCLDPYSEIVVENHDFLEGIDM